MRLNTFVIFNRIGVTVKSATSAVMIPVHASSPILKRTFAGEVKYAKKLNTSTIDVVSSADPT